METFVLLWRQPAALTVGCFFGAPCLVPRGVIQSYIRIFPILSLPVCFVFFIYLKDQETQTEIFHPLFISPNTSHSQEWARLAPGACNSVWVFHMGVRDPGTQAIIWCICTFIGRWTGTQTLHCGKQGSPAASRWLCQCLFLS